MQVQKCQELFIGWTHVVKNKYYEGRHFENSLSSLRNIICNRVMGDKKFYYNSFSNKEASEETIRYLRKKISEILSEGF